MTPDEGMITPEEDPAGHEQDSWAHAILASPQSPQSHAPESSASTGPAPPQKRGRPAGTIGSRSARQSVQNWIANQAAEANDGELEVVHEPGTIEFARQVRQQKVQERRALQQEARLQNAAHMDRGGSMESCMGDNTQQTLWAVFQHVQHEAKSRTAPSRDDEADHDPVVDLLLSGDAVTAPCKTVTRLLKEPGGLQDLLLQVGAALFAFGTWMWGVFLSHVLALLDATRGQPQWRPILQICKLRYDETPSKVRVAVSNEGTHTILSKFDQAETFTHAKVIQSEHTQAVLLQNMSDKSFSFCLTRLPTNLSAVDRTTAENTRSALWQQISAIPEYSRLHSAFDMAVRISVADRYTANLRAEVGLQQRGYMENFVNVFFPCDVHKMHSSIRNASDNAGADVAGLLNTGLACADLGATKTLRGILVSIFDEEMEILHSPPHIEVGGPMDDFRQGVLDLYLPMHSGIKRATKKTHARIRFILQYFLNGDLTSSRIIHHCQRGCCQTEAATKQHCALYLSWALIPHKLPVLSRKTWTGYHSSLSWVGILSTHHGLFQRVMEKYVGTPAQTVALPALTASSDNWLDAMLALQDDGPGETPGLETADAKAEEDKEEPGETEWVKKKKQQKRSAKEWVATRPGHRIAILTDNQEPLFLLMNKFLKMSGAHWRRKQEKLAFQSGTRNYSVLEAALGRDVQECQSMLLAKLSASMRAIPPEEQLSWELRSLRFKIISCGACAVQILLWLPRSGMPYQLFTLLLQPDSERIATAMAEWPLCMRDSLASMILEKFASPEELRSAECRACLEALAAMIDCDIAEIEARHAQTRDFCLSRARGWPQNLESVAARFLCTRHGEQSQKNASSINRGRAKKNKATTRRGGGGAWRAFIHERCSGKKFERIDFKRLAEEYHALPEHEKARFQHAGEAGSVSHKAGFKSFGTVSTPLPPKPYETIHGALALPQDEAAVFADSGDLVPFGANLFAEKYSALMKDFQSAVSEERISTKETDMELQKQLSNVEGAPLWKHSQQHLGPMVQEGEFQLCPMPVTSTAAVQWNPPICKGVQATVSRQHSAWKKKFKLKSALLEGLKKRCTVFIHDEQPKIVDRECQVFRMQDCRRLGICVCGSSEDSCPDALHFFRNLQQWMRSVFFKRKKVPSLARQRLETERCIVLGFTCNDHFADAEHHSPKHFAHIGHINFSTWHFALLKMMLHSTLPDGALLLQLNKADANGFGSPAGAVHTDMFFLKDFVDFRLQWSVTVFVLSKEQRHWTDWTRLGQEELIPVIAASEVDTFLVWRGSDREADSRRQQQKKSRKVKKSDLTGLEGAEKLLLADQRAAKRPRLRRTSETAGVDMTEFEGIFSDDSLSDPETRHIMHGDDVYAPDDEEALQHFDSEEEALVERVQSDSDGKSHSPLDASDSDSNAAGSSKSEGTGDEAAGRRSSSSKPEASCIDKGVADLTVAETVAPHASGATAAGTSTASDLHLLDNSSQPDARKRHARATAVRDPHATEVFVLGDLGELRYHPNQQKLIAVCRCKDPDHEDCRRQRTTVGSEHGKTKLQQGQGRPIGHLVSWLHSQKDFMSQHDHSHNFKATHEERMAGRCFLYTFDGGKEFAERAERPQREDEDSEPEKI